MEYVIHLTDNCNLNCKYCYEKNKTNKSISFVDIKRLIDYECSKKSKYAVIAFYGGEPLLRKDIIKNTVDYIKSIRSKTKFYYTITTNGTLLDDDFIEFMKKNNFINIGYSIDGMKESQDLNRKTVNGKGTFEIVLENAKKIINSFDTVIAMSVVTKNNISNLSKNVKFLIDLGFKNINLQFDYSQNWQDKDLIEIKKQYNEVADIYSNKILEESDVEIPLFDDKIKSYIRDEYDCNDSCQFGINNINVGTDGNFYPCMQFVGDLKYIIGNCKDGIDINARLNLIKSAQKENSICKTCSIRKRCKHTCACRNYTITKDINELSPIVCETEKIIIEESDKIAEKLYKQKSKLFIQKFYNDNYILINNLANKIKKRS